MSLPSDAFLQHLPSYLGFSSLGRGVSLYGCSSKAQLLLLTSDEGYPHGCPSWPWMWNSSSWPSCTHVNPRPNPKMKLFKSNLQNWEQVHKLGIDWSLFAYISVLVFRKDWLQIREELDHCRLTCLGQYDLPSWKRKWQLTPVFLPGKFHGRRRLVGYSPWGHKESDMT